MRIATFFLLATISSTTFGKSMECQVLKERIFNEVKYTETLRATSEDKSNSKTDNPQTSKFPFSDAYAPLIQQQRKLTSELTIEQYTKEYKQKCE